MLKQWTSMAKGAATVEELEELFETCGKRMDYITLTTINKRPAGQPELRAMGHRLMTKVVGKLVPMVRDMGARELSICI